MRVCACFLCALYDVSQMALLGTRVELVATTAATSSDKVNAVSSSAAALHSQLEWMKQKNATDVPALDQKVDCDLLIVLALRLTRGLFSAQGLF